MDTNCKGRHTVTAKVDGEMREALDRDADRLGDFRADRVRDALMLYVRVRRGDFVCPTCGEPIQLNL